MLQRLTIFTVLLAFLFFFYPQIDLYVSHLFYDPGRGGFWLKDNKILEGFYYLVKYSRYILPVCFAAIILVNLATKRKFIFSNREVAFLFLALLLGPVLMTGIFKDYWHRARPAQTIEFGGDKKFTPAFVMSDSCPENCYSFVSGHASMGFYFTAFALVIAASPKKRKAVYAGLLLLGAVISFSRVMQGQHFLSDVLFGGLFTLIIIYATHLFVFQQRFAHLGGSGQEKEQEKTVHHEVR